MTIESISRKLVAEFSSRRTLRAGSLITTIFGDAIAPRGGTVWLGSLIAVMRDFGASERLVRTSVYRLAQDGWLRSTQVGRRSYYGLSDEGRERFEQATHRIYGEPATDWDRTWCLVLLAGLETEARDVARQEHGWLGFGKFSANLLAHPAPDMADLDTTLGRLRLSDDVVVLEAETVHNEAGMRRLAHDSWNLADIDERYAGFVARFRPLITASGAEQAVAPRTAFLIRTLLIQEYRKILLRDPQLPAELLPAGWHGTAAYQLCRNLYRAIVAPAEAFLTEVMETADGPLPPPGPAFYQRFGGLDA
ncbi:MAG: phenylacetic acid degradation operon negative regulatory protein PaaX [Woeseiaceae bacterium]|nr:phenylacetic acid degradation operon negative regulatory protein PaaX [Woeseiaceae bacterium]